MSPHLSNLGCEHIGHCFCLTNANACCRCGFVIPSYVPFDALEGTAVVQMHVVTQPNGEPLPAPCAISGCQYAALEADLARVRQEKEAEFQRYDIAAAERDQAEELLNETRVELDAADTARRALIAALTQLEAQWQEDAQIATGEYARGHQTALVRCTADLAAIQRPSRTEEKTALHPHTEEP